MALPLPSTGTYNMDATGATLNAACTIWNANFATLYAGTGGTPLVINTATPADNAYTIFSKCNSNFAYLFGLPANAVLTNNVVNVGSVPYKGVIGLADPGYLACSKVNANFMTLSP